MADGREIWTYFQGTWHQGNYPIMGAADHGTWLGTMVFDGARAFDGVTPDLDLHCARTVQSARKMGLNAPITAGEIIELAQEGVSKFPSGTGLYIRPMMWSRDGTASYVLADPDSTAFALCLEGRPMPEPKGFTVTTTQFSRPMHTMAPTDAKAACLYPNNARMIREANAKGFDNAVSLDPLGNVAETATSNIWMAKDGKAYTPIANGTFLAGITRARVMQLLRDNGTEVIEKTLTLDDFRNADEVFSTGNALKVTPITKFEDRAFDYGPVARRARELYWDYAHS